MRLERADAGEAGNKLNPASLDTPGMVQISAARQQLIGVRTDEVRRDSSSHVLRVPGRIAVDDQRLYRIVAAADGWIVDLGQNTVGRFVKKDQFLASYYQKDLLYTERLFLLSIPANEPLPTQTKDFSQASIRTAGSANPQFPIDSLRGLGMSDLQIEEIHRTRAASPHISIYSPVSGFVLTRNISPSQRFDKGTELYRIADISRVWVMTDIFEKDREFVKPGAEATVRYQGREFQARMSDALPQFDPQSRTLKTRFELDNPGHVLQPDMFVDVELDVEMPPAITVPADAVIDSGRRKTVLRRSRQRGLRAARRGDRLAARRPRADSQGPDAGRAHRGLRQLPDRFREPDEDSRRPSVRVGHGREGRGREGPRLRHGRRSEGAGRHPRRSTAARPTTSAPRISARRTFEAAPARKYSLGSRQPAPGQGGMRGPA